LSILLLHLLYLHYNHYTLTTLTILTLHFTTLYYTLLHSAILFLTLLYFTIHILHFTHKCFILLILLYTILYSTISQVYYFGSSMALGQTKVGKNVMKIRNDFTFFKLLVRFYYCPKRGYEIWAICKLCHAKNDFSES